MADIDYDPAKSNQVYQRHGFTLGYASRIFDGPVWEWQSPVPGEHRIRAMGYVDDRAITVIYTWRGNTRRIVTARPARRAERHGYASQKS